MQTATLVTALCLVNLATPPSAAAGGAGSAPPHVFELRSGARPAASQKLVPDAAEEFLIEVDPAAVAANPPTLSLELPGIPLVDAVRTRFVDYGPDWKSWTGTLRRPGAPGKGTGYVYLGYHGDQLTGLIDFEGEHYRITGGRGENHRLFRLSGDLSPLSCGMETPADPMETLFSTEGLSEEDLSEADAPPALEAASVTSVTATSETPPCPGATNRIDVLIVYPKEFFTPSNAAEESSLPTFVRDSISLANEAFCNSGIPAYYKLVGVVPLIGSSQPGTGTKGLYSSLTWLEPRNSNQPSLSPPQEVEALRTAFGADVVSLYIPFGWNADNNCGIASLPLAPDENGIPRFARGSTNSNDIVPDALKDRAFSVNRYNCGLQDYTLGHEIGHNYGMHHHDVNPFDAVRWLYPHGRGKVLNLPDGTVKATVMACTPCTGCRCLPRTDPNYCPVGPGPVCNRIPYFSDPFKTYPGTNISLGSSNSADPRDNARVGRDNVANYAAFRVPTLNTPPKASFTVSCAGRTCTFNAGSSTDNAPIPSNGYWWDFGDGKTGTGQTYPHTYNAAGSYRVHLVVKDEGGQTGVVWGTVNPTIAYEGYHDVSMCTSIHGWAWDTTPNAAISVDIYRDGSKVATVPANQYRQDLLNAGKGNGYHAFVYVPNNLWKDGVWHSSMVRYAGTGTNLYTTPRNLICDARMFPTQIPTEGQSTGGQVYTVGTQFSSTHNGFITELGYWRSSLETGSNILRLWPDTGGVPLASVPTSCTSSGWCWGVLPQQVAITAGTRYRASVTLNTHQEKTGCGIGSGITNGPLTAHSGFWLAGDTFPTNGSCSNFFVDVKFGSKSGQ